MNAKEFEEWFRYHRARFSSVDAMIDKAATRPEPLAEKEIKLAWAAALRSCPLSDAKAASDDMHAGREEAPWVDNHPAKVAEICRRKAAARRQSVPVYRGGEQAFRCLLCEDYGWVQCWPQEAIAEFVATGAVASIGHGYTMRPCSCEAGNVRAQCFPAVSRYDPYWTLPIGVWGPLDRREQEKLRDWLKARKPKNYEDAFAEYGGR